MTLVANISIGGRPVLLSDLMLSRKDDGKEYEPFVTPLHLDPNPVVRKKMPHLVAGLSQKVTVLSPRLAVAFAGSVCQAEFAIRSLNDHLPDIKYELEGLLRFLDERCKPCDNLFLTGLMILDKQGTGLPIARFAWPPDKGKQFSSEQFGHCYVG